MAQVRWRRRRVGTAFVTIDTVVATENPGDGTA